MKSSEFREVLTARISSEEKEMLRTSDLGLYISNFNRSVCLRIIEPEMTSAVDPDVDLRSAEELEGSLRTFLEEYMSDHPEAHKWIILSCLELTFVEKQPMHPQKSAKWVTRDGHLLGLDSDTFYIYHVAAVMVDNLRRLLLGINLSDKAIMDFDFPGVGFPV